MKLQLIPPLFLVLISCQNNLSRPFNDVLSEKINTTDLIDHNARLGMGIRGMNFEKTGDGIVYDDIDRSTDAKGGKTKAHAEIVTSFQELARKSNLSIDTNFKLF